MDGVGHLLSGLVLSGLEALILIWRLDGMDAGLKRSMAREEQQISPLRSDTTAASVEMTHLRLALKSMGIVCRT
jgi:hypothetical protein